MSGSFLAIVETIKDRSIPCMPCSNGSCEVLQQCYKCILFYDMLKIGLPKNMYLVWS